MVIAIADEHWEMHARLHALITHNIPEYKLVIRDTHWLLGLLPWPDENTTITVAPRVYMPLNIHEAPEIAWRVLAHEYIHLCQAQTDSRLLFMLKYSFPQCLALLSLIGFLLNPYFLLFLLFILPLPAYYRMRYEMEGYLMSIAVNYWRTGYVSSAQRADVKAVFKSGTYYYMWPFKHWVDRKVNTEIQKLESGEYDDRPGYCDVYKLIKEIWSE